MKQQELKKKVPTITGRTCAETHQTRVSFGAGEISMMCALCGAQIHNTTH